MSSAKIPWSEPALNELMREVAIDVKARAESARERLANDPLQRERVLELLSSDGFGLNKNQELLAPGDLMRSYIPLSAFDVPFVLWANTLLAWL